LIPWKYRTGNRFVFCTRCFVFLYQICPKGVKERLYFKVTLFNVDSQCVCVVVVVVVLLQSMIEVG